MPDASLDEATVPRDGRRARLRANPATRHPYRVAIFLAGLLCIAVGIALAVLPGPLTIPPVLLGLWIWSWEFAFAQRFFDSFKEKGHEAWEQARRRPVAAAAATAVGLAAAAATIWAVSHFDLISRAKDAIGL